MKDSYHLKNDVGGIAVMAFLTPDVNMHERNRWILNRIAVARGTERGQGWGTKLLVLICENADAEHAELLLGVSPDGPGYFRRLAQWYRRHGFTPYKRRFGPVNNLMIRKPKRG